MILQNFAKNISFLYFFYFFSILLLFSCKQDKDDAPAETEYSIVHQKAHFLNILPTIILAQDSLTIDLDPYLQKDSNIDSIFCPDELWVKNLQNNKYAIRTIMEPAPLTELELYIKNKPYSLLVKAPVLPYYTQTHGIDKENIHRIHTLNTKANQVILAYDNRPIEVFAFWNNYRLIHRFIDNARIEIEIPKEAKNFEHSKIYIQSYSDWNISNPLTIYLNKNKVNNKPQEYLAQKENAIQKKMSPSVPYECIEQKNQNSNCTVKLFDYFKHLYIVIDNPHNITDTISFVLPRRFIDTHLHPHFGNKVIKEYRNVMIVMPPISREILYD